MLSAQQGFQSSLFFGHRYLLNPAYAGFDRSLSITAGYRSQWEGVSGQPVNQIITAQMPLYILQGGVGMTFENEYIGAERNLRLSLSYNYIYENSWGFISGGIKAGVIQKRLDGTLLRTPQGTYEGNIVDHQDHALDAAVASGLAPNVGLGVYIISNLGEFGISIDQLSAGKLKLDNTAATKVNVQPQINLYAEYYWPVLERLSLYPSALIKSDFLQTQADVVMQAAFDDRYYAGLGWRGWNAHSFDAAVIHLGLRLDHHWKVYYAYDVPITGIGGVGNGSHELIINYNLNKRVGLGLPPKTIYNPLY